MEVNFKTKKLEKQYIQSKEAIKEYGPQVGRKYIQRITILKTAKSFEELYSLPGLKFHPLKGNRKGEFAISLTGFWRLIITNDGEGNFDIAKIEEVSDHYGN
ncbi:type II toxin-antitoxin system RelE/ParE family toxin [Poseidonibacter ostreae]|uniref:Plasmid maintenance system killer n=1 Tax=Poseidonibacter ostreae TaxID=2654171 RepID=A0A6L4WRC0_9BACT|nr:type II toxin-antitoxin system RelE/ParE family toxin [Poseidonibacter ostreae]KAB7885199.1 plasmid maintenance system killer [Poseidonibacter ostreae]KAB7886070.1 plasmid maintenance system killer [Poseidonibacter ostreae]KAB7889609.1 plasmid maintenance system killer [Poseidonibacter ostreae]